MRSKKFAGVTAIILAMTLSFTGCSTIQQIVDIKTGTTQAPIEYTTEASKGNVSEESSEASGEYATEEPVTEESGERTTDSEKTTTAKENETPKSTEGQKVTKPNQTTNPTTVAPQKATEEETTIIVKTEDDRLAVIFWEKYGDNKKLHTDAQNQAACKAAVSLVKEIMANYASDFDREMALHDYICKLCVYDSESVNSGDTSHKQSPYAVLVENSAVYQGYANTFYICLNMMGIEAYYISGSSSDGTSHAWNQVCIAGDWYEVDCTWDDEGSIPSYEYFNLTTAEMNAAGHSKYKVSRKVTCNGGEYGKQYFSSKVTAEFKKAVSDIYFDSVGKVESYIRKNVSRGIYEMDIYMTKAVGNQVSDYATFIRGLELNDFYDFEATYTSSVYDGLWEIQDTAYLKLKLIDLSFYESMDNYFTDNEECLLYLNGLASEGNKSATIYASKEFYDKFISGTSWKAVETSAVGKMLTLYKYKLQYTG